MKQIKTAEELDNYAKRKFVNILYSSSTFYPSSFDFDSNYVARFKTKYLRDRLLKHDLKRHKFIIVFNNLLLVYRSYPVGIYRPIIQFYAL